MGGGGRVSEEGGLTPRESCALSRCVKPIQFKISGLFNIFGSSFSLPVTARPNALASVGANRHDYQITNNYM